MGAVCYDAEPMTGYAGEIGKSRNFDTSICYNKYIGGFGMNVLIVEDDEAIANLLYMDLSDEGYQCVCAYDGKTAADLLEEKGI